MNNYVFFLLFISLKSLPFSLTLIPNSFHQIEVKTEVRERTKRASNLSVQKAYAADNVPVCEESEELDQRTFSVVC